EVKNEETVKQEGSQETPVEQTKIEPTAEHVTTEAEPEPQKVEAKQEIAVTEAEKEEETVPSFKEWKILAIREGKTPQGSDFAKVAVQDKAGNRVIAFAKDKALQQLDEVEEQQTYLMDIQNVNGYDFLVAVGELVVA
ncbi:MAG: hypothetical protein Q8934_23025, partial [Bacillota bacterium]|nr:hypothetical protein [Bacillota bacterium]